MQDIKKIKKSLTAFFLLILLAFTFTPSTAAAQMAGGKFGFDYAGEIDGLGTRDLRSGIMEVVNILLGLLGIFFILIIFYSVFAWMSSGGDDDKMAKSKKTLIAGVIGLGIILGAYVIANFVVNSLSKATT